MRNKYTFTKDEHSINLYKTVLVKDEKSKNFGQTIDKLIGHYSSVENVIKKLVHLELIESGDVKELLRDFKSVQDNVHNFIRESMSGVEHE